MVTQRNKMFTCFQKACTGTTGTSAMADSCDLVQGQRIMKNRISMPGCPGGFQDLLIDFMSYSGQWHAI
jgi:hypothetical protein